MISTKQILFVCIFNSKTCGTETYEAMLAEQAARLESNDLHIESECEQNLITTPHESCSSLSTLVFNDYTLSANYFHPIYRGQKLNATQRKQVDDYIFGVLDGNGLESSRLFNSEEGTFSSLKRKGITSPKTYWYFAQKQGHTDLATLATKLMKIPASTCQLERLFSNWGFVHSDNRNRLSPERSKMLTNIYFTLRSTDTIDEEEDDDNDEIECA